MEKVMDFINAKTISRDSSYHKKVFVSDKVREECGVDGNVFFYEEIVDPHITIRETDLMKALMMARKLGVEQGMALLRVE